MSFRTISGTNDGVFLFFDGQVIGKPGKYMFIPQRIQFRSTDLKHQSTFEVLKRTFDDQKPETNVFQPSFYRFFVPHNLPHPGDLLS